MRDTAARGKGTIVPHASQTAAPQNRSLPAAEAKLVPAAGIVSSAAEVAAHARGNIVRPFKLTSLQAALLKPLVDKQHGRC